MFPVWVWVFFSGLALGLRYLYFPLEGAVGRFAYLHYGLVAGSSIVVSRLAARNRGS